MQMPDLEVFKEIPGYKAILKAVLKTQIQSLVEQLSQQTGEESVIVTASLEDGSLTHLGSDFGKVFLDSHDQIKSQFLGFCLKRNQMLHKSQTVPSSIVRKKGPFGAGRRPRLAPYYMANPSKKAPRKSTPRFLHTQQRSESNQNYTESLEPAYNHCEESKPGTSQMNAVVKTEPGMDGEGEAATENQIYMDNMSNAFPSSNYPSENNRINNTKVKIEEFSGIHSMIGAENQPVKRRGRGRMKIKADKNERQVVEKFTDGSYSALGKSSYQRGRGRKTRGQRSGPSRRGRKVQQKTDQFLNVYNQDTALKSLAESDIYTDSNVRPYPCNQCPKRFKERHHLTYHLRIHSGQRPYVCDVCCKSFTQSSSLNTHKKIHMKEISCGVCGLRFRKKSDFNVHICTNQPDFIDEVVNMTNDAVELNVDVAEINAEVNESIKNTLNGTEEEDCGNVDSMDNPSLDDYTITENFEEITD